jgi:hypothetical protein
VQTQLHLEKLALEKKLEGGEEQVREEEEDHSAFGGWPWQKRADSQQQSPAKTADSCPET